MTNENVFSVSTGNTPDLSPACEACFRVLVVDDDQDISLLLSEGLELHGFHADTEEDGEQAMQRLLAESYDLVLIDLLMPVVSGLRLIAWLRDEQQLSIPVIVFTGHNDEETLDLARQAGADEVLVKPFNLDKLCNIVKRLVDLPNPIQT